VEDPPTSGYAKTAAAYVDGVRVLFATSGAPAGERGGRGPVSYEELAAKAEELAPVSEQLTQEAGAQLADEDPMARIQGATSLMAKALTDLQVSAYLLQAAVDQEEEYGFAGGDTGRERGRSSLGPDDELLNLVLGESQAIAPATDRGTGPPGSLPAARGALSHAVQDAIDLISSRAGRLGQSALGGLVGMGAAELASAAGMVGMDIAEALGQAEAVTRLYELFRSYVTSAVESLIALVGRPTIEATTNQALEWIGKLGEGELLGQHLQRLYETDRTVAELGQDIAASQAGLDQFVAAIQDVDRLDGAFHQQIKLAEKLLKGLRFVGSVATAALPASKLLQAGIYMILGVYVVAAGADYVDAPHLRLLDRVPGVRQVVEKRLAIT